MKTVRRSASSGSGVGAAPGVELRSVAMNVADPLIAVLERLDVPYELFPCDPALADTADFCAAYGFSPDESANSIVVASKREPKAFAACVVLATTRLDVNGTVRRRLGVRKASFASPDDTRALTGMEIGGVTPFGLPEEVPLWIDSRVMEPSRIVLGGGSRDRKVIAPPQILTALPGSEVVTGLALDPSP